MKHQNVKEMLSAAADAIRTVTGTFEKIKGDDIPDAIKAIGDARMIDVIRPVYLSAGDTVAIVALSSKVEDETVIPAATALLEEWGLNVDMTYYADPTSDYQAIANRLVGALSDNNVNAIICARGGYGSIHILDLIPVDVAVSHPKWLVGYSDVTGYLCHFVSHGVMGIHGPMCSSVVAHPSDDGSLEKLRALLFGEDDSHEHTFTDGGGNNVTGKAVGVLAGGNMSTLLPYLKGDQSPFKYGNDYIVFLEDNGTNYKRNVYRYFKAVHYALGTKLKGVIIGDYSITNDSTQTGTLYSIAKECFPGIPIAFTQKIGHADANYPVVEGSFATLNVTSASNATLTFLESEVEIDYNLTHVTKTVYSSGSTLGSRYTALFEAEPGYDISTFTVYMGDVNITSTAYNAESGLVNIAEVTDGITITASAESLGVPEGYTPVKYISCAGTQWFDAGFKGDNTINFNALVQGTDTTTLANYAIFGGRTSSSRKRYDCTFGKSEDTYNVPLGSIFWGKYNASSQYNSPTSMTGKVRLVTSGDAMSIYNDGSLVSTFNHSSGSAYTGSYNVYVGACNNAGSTVNAFKGRLFRLTFGTTADLVPVVRDSDDKPGMYDVVRSEFYYSSTGTDFGVPEL